jgi:hypothetical protein
MSGEHTALPDVLKHFHGQLTAATVAAYVPRAEQSGDVHLAVYDYAREEMYVGLGIFDAAAGAFAPGGKAYERPLLRFSLQALWNEERPE